MVVPDAIKPRTVNNDAIKAISVDDIPADDRGGGGGGEGEGAASGPAGTGASMTDSARRWPAIADLKKSDIFDSALDGALSKREAETL